MRNFKHILLICTFLGIPTAYATDSTLEKQWSDELVKTTDEGEIAWLDIKGGKFLSLYREDTTGTLQGAAIILHSLGAHPNWPDVIAPVRNLLPTYGWATLSMQMPVMPMGEPLAQHVSLFDEMPERIQAAVGYLQAKGINNIVLIGYGLGAAMGASFLATNEASGIKAFVGISLVAYEGVDDRMYSPTSLEKIKLPILDIYGGRDLDNVILTSKTRANAARKAVIAVSQQQELTPFKQSATAQAAFTKRSGFIAYRQFEIPGADHSFRGFEDLLGKRIIGWLKQHAGGITVAKPADEAKNQSE